MCERSNFRKTFSTTDSYKFCSVSYKSPKFAGNGFLQFFPSIFYINGPLSLVINKIIYLIWGTGEGYVFRIGKIEQPLFTFVKLTPHSRTPRLRFKYSNARKFIEGYTFVAQFNLEAELEKDEGRSRVQNTRHPP